MTGHDRPRTVGRPLTRPRSAWVEGDPMEILGTLERTFTRQVGDGTLTAIVGHEPDGWHLSISFADNRRRNSRYPRWDEITGARYELVPDRVTMALLLPPPDEYVALHDTTFHLHEIGGAP